MTQPVLRIDALPAGALDAAAEFHATWLEQARKLAQGNTDSLTVVLPRAPYDHRDWRLAAARDLARAAAPVRVNLIAGDDTAAIAAALMFVQSAPGVTGQYLPLDADGAGNPVN